MRKDNQNQRGKVNIEVTAGYRTALFDGCLVADSPFHMATEHFYYAKAGDRIELCDREFLFAVATFVEKWEERYIYSYDYKRDSAWLTYRQDLQPDSYSQREYVFTESGYFRVCLKRADGRNVTTQDAERINDILHIFLTPKSFEAKECFTKEIAKTVMEVRKTQEKNTLTLCLVSDSHYTVNGTWEDSADNIKKVLKSVRTNGIVHLGDLTDGMTSQRITKDYVNIIKEDLLKNGLPVYMLLGNHDSNYFRANKEPLSLEEEIRLFGISKSYYYKDFEYEKIRCLFLNSYDVSTPVRYGFSDEEVEWVEKTLNETEPAYKVIIFSHEAPLPWLDYWARLIRNGEKLVEILEEYNAKEDRQILAFIHGHTHAEHIYRGCSFPIISIGCNKCEYYPDKKPRGSMAYMREQGTVTQDLWDMLVVSNENQKLSLIRFGAGENRAIDCSKMKSTWKAVEEEKRRKRSTKIWAHRGSSGFAPENTLPAFQIAKDLQVDGIELDVQLTKDGEIVVIHDEIIDRVSDGHGYVKDFTLAELRKFNFNTGKTNFGYVKIPTLKEVYQMFQDTDFVINVELKTNIFAYDESFYKENNLMISCIEEKVHLLTEQMHMTKQVIYSSFNHSSIIKMQQYVTNEETAFLYADGILDVTKYGHDNHVAALHPVYYGVKNEDFVKNCHDKGMAVHVWNVNEKEEALRLRALQVDALITDHPGKMKEWLNARE